MHKGGGSPSCGGSREQGACQRFGLARNLPAAWGEPARPGFPPEGETGKGARNLRRKVSLLMQHVSDGPADVLCRVP
jgi:hypothetical protein